MKGSIRDLLNSPAGLRAEFQRVYRGLPAAQRGGRLYRYRENGVLLGYVWCGKVNCWQHSTDGVRFAGAHRTRKESSQALRAESDRTALAEALGRFGAAKGTRL
jgi:hypothetical protein